MLETPADALFQGTLFVVVRIREIAHVVEGAMVLPRCAASAAHSENVRESAFIIDQGGEMGDSVAAIVVEESRFG